MHKNNRQSGWLFNDFSLLQFSSPLTGRNRLNMKRISQQIIILIIIVSFSCTKQKECPAFNDDDLRYIPYKIGDTLNFINQQGELFAFFIEKFKKSEAYNFKCKDIYGICSCINYVDIISTDTENSSSYSFLKLEQSDASDMQYFKYHILDFYFEFDFRNELPYIHDFDNFELIDSVKIFDTFYTEVVVVSNLNNSVSKISKVYFNKTVGILRFSEKLSGKEWSLVN